MAFPALHAQNYRGDLRTYIDSPRALPSHAPAESPNPYDPKFNAYNFKPTNTRRLRAALGRAMVGGLAEIVAIGASDTAGCTSSTGPTFDRTRAWPMQMRDELARHGMPVAGTGMVRVLDDANADARWVLAGAW